MTNILIYNEYIKERKVEEVAKIYPHGIHGALSEIFAGDEYNVRCAALEDIREKITPEILKETDVMLWWGHSAHKNVPDDIADLVVREVNKGMGLILLHSSHLSKPMLRLLGTSCTLSWRASDRERLWTCLPSHPIAAGIPVHFELQQEEMYGEPFDIPNPDEIVFMGWFAGGEVFRSGVTYRRGYGKIFYFQPGHEKFPTFYNETVRKIIRNAVEWAKPCIRLEDLVCPNTEALEK